MQANNKTLAKYSNAHTSIEDTVESLPASSAPERPEITACSKKGAKKAWIRSKCKICGCSQNEKGGTFFASFSYGQQ